MQVEDGGEVVGQRFDGGTKLEGSEPALGDGSNAKRSAEKIAGDGAGGVAIAGMIDGENDAVLEILGGESAVEAHGEGFFGDKAFAEFAKSGALARAGFGERFGFGDGGESFFMRRVTSKFLFCHADRIRERLAGENLADDESESAGGENPAGMAVR